MSLVAAQLFHALACRSPVRFGWRQLPPNPYLLAALGGSLSLQLLVLALPSLGHFLQVTPLNWADAVVIAISALLPLTINEALKG
jgi:Ca2+-transporting ATPase